MKLRRIIHSPGPAKRRRWEIALHESGHAVAFRELCEVHSQAFVFTKGRPRGLCCHGRPAGCIDGDLIATAAGSIAGEWADLIPAPWGRAKRIRGPRQQAGQPDAALLLKYLEVANRSRVVLVGDVELAARRFVTDHITQITAFAEQLYLHGHASMPAPERKHGAAADVPPAEVFFKVAAAS